MKKDLENREDIVRLLEIFYDQAMQDGKIGFFFTEVVPLDLSSHIPVIADFWESVIFQTHGYRKNVMEIHQHISALSPIHKEHLDRWVALFHATIDQLFEGPNATLMQQRAKSIATLMQIKLTQRLS